MVFVHVHICVCVSTGMHAYSILISLQQTLQTADTWGIVAVAPGPHVRALQTFVSRIYVSVN